MEMLDVYDEAGTHLGAKDRITVHRDGDWHRTLHCWVVAQRASGPVVLLQRRGAATIWYPGRWDVTAAGHLSAGESVEDALREVEEELGLVVRLDQLSVVGDLPLEVRTDTVWCREVNHVFALRRDRPLTAYTFPDGSVAGLVELALEDFAAWALHGAAVPGVAFTPGDGTTAVTLDAGDLVPLGPGYFAALVPALQALFPDAAGAAQTP